LNPKKPKTKKTIMSLLFFLFCFVSFRCRISRCLVIIVFVVVILGAIFDGAIETLSHKTVAARHRLGAAELAAIGALVPVGLVSIQQLLRAKLEFAQITDQHAIISLLLFVGGFRHTLAANVATNT
jgi:accessory gene regulator protein AgrB